MLIETFIRKQLRLKAHRVTQVETTEESMIVYIDRMGNDCCGAEYAGDGVWKCIV